MTANLLTHSNLFLLVESRSGANRTLTRFQSEPQHQLLETWALYNKNVTLHEYRKMKTPLLLVHGGADNNPRNIANGRYFPSFKRFRSSTKNGYFTKEHTVMLQGKYFAPFMGTRSILEKLAKN
jgi:hypothetical protein